MSTADKCASCADRKTERLGLDATIAQQRVTLREMQRRYERSEARVADLERTAQAAEEMRDKAEAHVAELSAENKALCEMVIRDGEKMGKGVEMVQRLLQERHSASSSVSDAPFKKGDRIVLTNEVLIEHRGRPGVVVREHDGEVLVSLDSFGGVFHQGWYAHKFLRRDVVAMPTGGTEQTSGAGEVSPSYDGKPGLFTTTPARGPEEAGTYSPRPTTVPLRVCAVCGALAGQLVAFASGTKWICSEECEERHRPTSATTWKCRCPSNEVVNGVDPSMNDARVARCTLCGTDRPSEALPKSDLERTARDWIDRHENSAAWREPGGARRLLTALLAEVDANAERRGRALAEMIAGHRPNDAVPEWVPYAYVIDRQEQYPKSSGIYVALSQVAAGLRRGNHIEAWKHGELDDLAPKGSRKPKKHHTDYATALRGMVADWRTQIRVNENALVPSNVQFREAVNSGANLAMRQCIADVEEILGTDASQKRSDG